MNKASINEIQDEIIEEFSLFEGDQHAKLEYIFDLSKQLPDLPEEHKKEENLIKGCQSKVWLISEREGDILFYKADSNTAITKGLISLLIRVLSGQKMEDIARADLYFIPEIGMSQFIGSQRSNGFANMVSKMKLDAAVAYKELQN
ncbi:SufE family protein [Nafulsella turpanensis]|uniref:SufE family protein n=1 Tax=Nafulsella turpanensis TaxID=1265690 RepID=UPI0003479556|nr:SufE family protein [Nafulsella turpanensis]